MAKKGKGTIRVEGEIPIMELNMPLDKKSIAAIQRCLAKQGDLTIKVTKVDFANGKLGDGWSYD
jgi:hypothetical protein